MENLSTKIQNSNSSLSYISSETAIVWIQSTKNNTLLTLTNPRGMTLSWSSAGVCGFKNSRKCTTHAAEMAAISLSEKISFLGYNSVDVKMKGLGRGKKKALSALSRSGLIIKTITENYNLPFNGCRRKGKRRI